MPLKNLINKPLAPGYAQIVQDEIPYSVQPTKGIYYNPEMAQANTNINSWWNSAYNNVTNIQLLTAQGSSIDANKQLDTNKDELYKLQDAFSLTDNPNEKKVLSDRIVMLNNENVLLQYKIDKSNDEVAYYNYQKSQHPVDIAFQLKSDYLQSQEKSNFKDWFQNESAQDLSSMYAYGAEMVAAMFAPAVIKYALPKILAGVGLEVTGAAEDLSWFAAPIGIVQAGLGAEQLISAATILSEAAASGALLWDMRKKETYSEMQDNFQSRLKDITDAYKSQNGDKEIDDRTMTKLRLQAYQGLDVLEHKNNSLILGDALELLPLALPWGGLFEGLKNSSRLASILSKALTVGLTTYSEGIEEGLQWKYGYDYKKGLYDSKVYHHGIVPNSLKEYGTDVLDYVKDRVDVNGGFFLNYKPTIFDNADFRNNVRAGMLGGLTMSGASAFMSTALDGYKYMKAKNEIKAFQGQMDIEDSKFQSDILTKYIVSGKSKFLHWALESYKNIDGVDKEKISMLQDTIKQINKEYDKVTDSSRVKFGFLETPNVIKKYLTKNDHINILKDTIQLKILEQIQDKKIKDFVAEQRPSNDGLLSEFTEMDSIPKTAPNRITDEINEIKNRLKDRLSVKYYLARKEIWSQWATAQAEKEIAEKVTNDADALKSANDKIEHLKYYYSHLLAELPSNQAGVKYNSEATFVRNMKAMFQMKKDFHAEKAYDIIKMADRGATLNDILHHIVTNNHALTPELIVKLDSLIQQAHDRGDVFDKQAKLDEILEKTEPHQDAQSTFERIMTTSPELLTEEHIKANDIADAELPGLTEKYNEIVNQPNVDPDLIDAYHQTKDSLLFNESNDDELLKIEFGKQNYLQGNQLVFNSFKTNDDYTDSAAVDTAIAKTKTLQDILDKHVDKDKGDFQDFKEEIKNQLETLNYIKEEVTKKLGDKLRKEEATLKENNKANWNSIGINVEDGTITDSELFNVIDKALDGELTDILEKLKTEEGRKDSHWYFLLLKDRLIHNNDNTEIGKFADEQINIIGNLIRTLPTLAEEHVLRFLKDPIHFLTYIAGAGLTKSSIDNYSKDRLIGDLRKANETNSQAIQFIDAFEKLLTYKRLQENISEDNTFSVSEMVKGLVKVIKTSPEFFPSPTQFLAITQFYEALNVVDTSNDMFSNFTYLVGIAGTGKTNVVLKWVFKLMGMSDKNSYALSKYTAQSETLSKSIDFKSANDFEQFFKDLNDKKDFFEKEAEYIIFDEIGLLNDSELGRFALAIQELNKRRTSPIQVLLLGDPQQLTENGHFGAAIDENAVGHNGVGYYVTGVRRLNPLNIIYRSNVSSLNTIVDIFRNAKGTIRKLVLPYSRDTKFGVQGSHDINDIFRVIQGRDATKTKRIITTKENLQIVQATIDKLPDDMKANLSVSTVIDAQSRTYDEVYIALDPNSKNYNRQMYVATSRANQYIFIVDSNIKFEQVESSDDTLLKTTNDDNFKKYKSNTISLVEDWNNKLGNKTEKPEEKEKEVKEQEEKKEEEVAEQQPKPENKTSDDLQSKKADIERRRQEELKGLYSDYQKMLDEINSTGRLQKFNPLGLHGNIEDTKDYINDKIKSSLNGNRAKEINAKYDAELAALEKEEVKPVSDIEAKKADIERRRQEELKDNSQNIIRNKLSSNPQFIKDFGINLNNNQFESTISSILDGVVKYGDNETQLAYNYKWNDYNISKINAKYDAEYIDKVKKGEFTKQQAKGVLKEIGRLSPELEKQIDDIDVSKEETPAPQEPTEEKKEPPVNPDENPDEADDNFTDEEFKDEDEETPNYIDDDDTIVETENKDLEDVEIDMTPEDSTSKIKEAYSWVKILLEKTKNFFTHKIIYIEHNSINSQVLYDDIKTTFGGRRYIKYAPAKVNAYDKVHYIKYAYGEGQSKYGYAIVKKTNDDPNDKNYVIIGLISNEEINGSTPLTDLLRNSNSLTTFADKRWINDLKHSESGTVEISTFNSIVEGYVKAISRQAFSYGQKYYKPDSKKIAGIIEQLKNKAFPGLKIQHQSYQFRVFGGFKDAKKPSWTYEGHTIPENIRNFVRSGIPYLVVKIHAVGYKEPKFFCIPMRTRKLNSSDKFFSKMKEYIDNCRKIEKLSDRNTTFGTSSFYSLISEVTLAVENGTELTKEITSKYGIDISTKKKQEDLKTICKAISDAYRVRQQLARNTKASFTDSNGVVLTDSYFTGTSKTGNKFAKRLKVIKVLSNNTDITEDNPNNLQPTHVTVTDGKTEKTISLADHKYKTNYENGELQTLFNDVAKSNRKVVIDGDFHFLRRKATIKGSIGDVIVHTGKSILPKSPKGKVLNLAIMERLISTDSNDNSNVKLGLVENGLRLNIKVRVGKVKEGQSGQIDESDVDSLETNFSHYTGNSMHVDAYVPGQTSDGSKQLITKQQESKVFSLIKEYVDKLKDKINIHDPGSNTDIRRQIGSGALLTYLNDKLGENSNEVLSYLSQHYGLTNIEAIRDLLRGIRNEFLTDEQIKALYLDNERVNLTRIKQGQKVTDVEETAKKDTKSDKDDKKLPPPPPDDNEDPDNNSDNVIFTNPVDDKKDEEEDPPKLSDVRAALTKSGRRLTIEQLREYARKVLPGITDEELQFLDKALGEILVKGKRAVGVFAEGMIRIIKNGDYSYKGWLKHELFHKIFREYLTPEERAKLYMDATHYYNRTFGTWLEIEEAIAEDFQQIDTSTVLGWLKDKIMRLFSLFNSHRRDIYKIFDMIEKGEFGKRERDTKTFYDAAPLLDVVKSFGGKNNIFRMAQELTLKVFSHENREVDKDHNLLIGKRVFRSEDEIIASLQNSFYKFKTQWDFNTNKPKDSYIAQVKDKDGKLVDVEKTVTDGDKQRLNELFDKFMSYNGKALYKKDDFIEIIDGLIYNKGVVKDIMSSIFPDSGFSVDEEQEKRNADLSNEILDRAGFNHMLNANKLIKYFLSTITKKDRVTLITYGNAWHNCLKAFQNFDFTVFDKSKDEALAEIKKVFIGSDTNIEIGKRLMDLIESADKAFHKNQETKVETHSNPRIHFFDRTNFVLDLREDTSVDLQSVLNSKIKDGKIVGHEIYIFKNNSKVVLNGKELSFSERYNSDFIQQTLTHINNTLTDEQKGLLGGDNLNMKVLALSLIQSENNQILKSLVSTFSSLSEYNFFFAEEKEDKSSEFVNPLEREFSMRFSYIPAGNVSGAITGSGVVRTSMLSVLANNTLTRNLLSAKTFSQLLAVLNLPVSINPHSFTTAVKNDIMLKFHHVIEALETNRSSKTGLTDEAVLDNQKTFINGLGEIVDDILGHDRNDSVRTGGKTKHKWQESSFGRDVLTAVINKNTKIFPFLSNTIYSKYNIFLNKTIDMIIDNDHIKAFKNRTITYLDENKTQFISREFLHGFINSLTEKKFTLFFNPISNRPNILGVKTNILDKAELKNAVRDAIKQHIEIIKQYNSGQTRQVKSISGNIANNEFSLFRGFKTQLDFTKNITVEEINKAVDEFYDEMIERSTKVQHELTDLFALENQFDKYKKSMLIQKFQEYYLNHTVQTYFLNQLVAGDELYYKEGRPEFDFIKRLAGVFAPGKKGFISRIFKGGRPNFVLAVMKDIEKEIVDELFKNSPIFRFTTNTTDAQGFMSERRYNEIIRMYGENFDVKGVTKPVCFDKDGHGIPIYMKYSCIVLTKELTDAFPELKAIAEKMEKGDGKRSVDELLFESAIKVGCPKTLSNFEDNFIHPDSMVTVNNYNYRIQQNPYHEIDSKTSLPSQIIHFLNSNFEGNTVDNTTFEKTQNVYQAVGKLQEIGFKRFIKSFGIDENSKIDPVIWRAKIAEAISKLPGSEAMVQLLKSNMTIDAKALSNRLIISFMSKFEDKAIKISIPGTKLVLQSQVGIQVYETEDGIKLYDKLTDEEKKTLQATELKYKVDSKGNVLYAECIVPSMLKGKVQLGDIVMNSLIGFRIPSSNLHSAIPIRVVGFYPSDTNVIITPKEVTTIHGSDFDVDSLFILRRTQFEHDITIGDKSYDKSHVIGMDDDNNFDFSDKLIKSIEQEITDIKDKILINTVKINADKEAGTAKDEITIQANRELKSKLDKLYGIQESYYHNAIFQGILDIISGVESREDMFTPISFSVFRTENKKGNHVIDVLGEDLKEDERKAFIDKLSLPEDTRNFTDKEQKLYDLLVNKTYKDKNGVVKPIPILTKLQILQGVNLERRNINTVEGKQLMHEDNATGAKLTGIFAKCMSVFNYLNFASKEDGDKLSGLSQPFEIMGKTYQQFQLREIEGSNGKVLETQDALVNAAIDNVKEGILALINANKLTGNVLPLLVNLGMPIDEIIMFLKQPILSKTQLKFNFNNKSKVINTIKSLLKSKGYDAEEIMHSPFRLPDLFNGLVNNKNLEDMSIEELLVQYAILEKFSEIYAMGTDLFENGQVISTIQNSPVTPQDISEKLDVINKVREKIQLMASAFKSNIFKVFHINNAVQQFEKTSDFINNTLWSYSPRVNDRINKYTDLFGTSVWDKYEDREDMRGSLIQFLMSNKFYNEYKDLTYTYDYKGEQVVLRGSEAYNHIIGDKINKMKTLYMGEHHGVTDSQELADIRRFLNCFTVDYKRSTRNRKIKIGYRDIEVRLFNILFRDTKNISPIERSSILAGGDALIKAKDGKDFLESMFKYLLISSDMTQGRFKYTEFIPTSITNEMDYTAFMDNLYKKVEDDKQLDTTFNWFMEQYVLRNSEYLPTYKTLFKSKKNEDKFEQPVWSKNNYQFTVSTKQEYNFPNYVVDETNPYQIAVYKRINNELKTATYVWMGIPNFSGVYQANDKMFTGEETEYNHQYQTWVKSNVDSFSNSITTEIKEDDPKLNFKVGDIAIFRNIDDILGTQIEKMVLTKVEKLPSKIEGRTYAKLTYEKGAYLKDGKFYKVMDITDDTFNKLSYTPKEKEEVLKTICK